MTLPIFSPSESVDPTKVRRSKDGRPYVKRPCPNWTYLLDSGIASVAGGCIDGRVAGARAGTMKQCPTCRGKGWVEILYTRCTSFVGVLEDRTGLERWKLRTVLVGVGVDQRLLGQLDATDPDDIDSLNRLANQAFEVGEGRERSREGTDLHRLTEYVDRGDPLPAELVDHETGQVRLVTLQDRADMAAWQRTVGDGGMVIVASERFVVQDTYQIGGTYDRLVEGAEMEICTCGKPLILDLKTGRIDYGAGKMAQQLAVYAHSKDYDPETGERSDQDVCTHFGLIVHLPQGTGEASVHVVDLEAGWADVALSSRVREHRREVRHRIWPIGDHPSRVG